MGNSMPRPSSDRKLLQQLGHYLLDSDTLMVVTLDPSGNITFMNIFTEKVTGYSSEELLGKTWEEIFLSEENLGESSSIIERIRSGQAAQVRASLLTKRGTKKVVSWDSFKVLTRKGESSQTMAIGKEVIQDEAEKSNLHREWETLTGIVNNVGAGLNLLDKERRIVWTNAQMQAWFGNGHLVGSYCYEVLNEHEHSGAACPSFYTFQTKSTGSISKWATTTDGKKRFFQFITTPILNDVSEVTHILELVIDITQRKEIEERKVESGKLASIGELAMAVAHEIRNPMTVIGGFTRRLKNKIPENTLVQQVADVILKESRRLEDMVLKVNLFLNPREPNHTYGHVNELLSHTLKAMNRDFEAAGVKVKTRFYGDIPPIMLDKNKIRQVFFNIFQNALDAMPEGGTVTITSAMKGDFVEVRIQDTGPGIVEEDVDSIFHAFFSGKQAGLGLGLTIASQIIHEHGGYINVEKCPDGRAAMFILGLPLHLTG